MNAKPLDRLGWEMKVRSVMREHGCDWYAACSFLGKRGGAVSGARRSSKARSIQMENRKQEAIGIR
jgi:hypothetical protein